MNNQAYQDLLRFVDNHSPSGICRSDWLYARYTQLWKAYYGHAKPVFVTRWPAPLERI